MNDNIYQLIDELEQQRLGFSHSIENLIGLIRGYIKNTTALLLELDITPDFSELELKLSVLEEMLMKLQSAIDMKEMFETPEHYSGLGGGYPVLKVTPDFLREKCMKIQAHNEYLVEMVGRIQYIEKSFMSDDVYAGIMNSICEMTQQSHAYFRVSTMLQADLLQTSQIYESADNSKSPVYTKEPEEPKLISDDIQFRAAAPAKLPLDYYSEVKIMMFTEEFAHLAKQAEEELDTKTKSTTSGIFTVERKQKIHIKLQSSDIEIEEDENDMMWNGKFATCTFDIYLPRDYSKKQVRLKARVYLEDTVLTDLKLILMVEAEQKQEIIVEQCSIASAYISYSSEDRELVSARIQGMLSTRPELDLFFDILSLRRGEYWEDRFYREIDKRDLLYLFWSRNAAKSSWVEREWKYALNTKGPDFIEPIPLERPTVCPPPPELNDRHFNDWLLLLIDNDDLDRI